jgi:pilus assembly protein CpaC
MGTFFPSSRRTISTVVTLLLIVLPVTGLYGQNAEDMRLTVGRSVVLDFPADIRQISTSDPAVVDAVAVSTREVLLNAKAMGSATIVIWSKSGERTIYGVTVEQNLDPLRRLLRDTFPSEDVQVQSSRDAISLNGRVATKEIADRAALLAVPFGKNIVSNLQIAPGAPDKQIVLRVKFAELDRRAAQSFGVNLVSTGFLNTIGRITTGQFSPPTTGELRGAIPGGAAGTTSEFSISDALNVFAFRPDLNLTAFIRALQNQSLLQILAEPNLVTLAGREASFLVGGEFPIPVLQGSGNAGAVTIQFREFGIRLTFTPTPTPHGTIRMHVRPEVSTVDTNNAVSVAGFLIPALATRRMETNVELREGQSFAIAGLIDNRVQDTIQKIPGLASIPLLGALFRSHDLQKNISELVVIVTPEYVSPMEPGTPHQLPAFPEKFLEPAKPGDTRSDAKSKKSEKTAQNKPPDGKPATTATDGSPADAPPAEVPVSASAAPAAPKAPKESLLNRIIGRKGKS